MQNPFQNAKGIKEKRAILREISKQAKPELHKLQEKLIEEGHSPIQVMGINLNKFLISNYEGKEFKSYKQWKKEGKTVKKGSKAWCIWGRPFNATAEHEIEKKSGEKETAEESYELYPIAHVFSDLQVE